MAGILMLVGCPGKTPPEVVRGATVREATPRTTSATITAAPLPVQAGRIVLEASCGVKRPCAPGTDVAVRLAQTTSAGLLYVFAVEDPGRSLFAGPVAVEAGESRILPMTLMAEEHTGSIRLEGAVFARPLSPAELDRLRAGEALVGAVGRLDVPVGR